VKNPPPEAGNKSQQFS